MKAGDWLHSQSFRDLVQVIAVTEAFGATSVRVWHPASDRVAVLTPADLDASGVDRAADALIAAVAGVRVADALASGALLAPTQSVVDPLPHQLRALSRAMSTDTTRMLLADEVGLGKTIEAGLIITERALRGQARRVLVLAPKGLVSQWQGELQRRFGEDFVALTSGEVGALAGRREDNFWLGMDRVIVPLDAVKPLDARRGWTDERIARHNIARSTNLAAAGWDIIVIDEAHRVAGYGEHVARHRLARLLADATPNLLLLSATPHVGKSDGFRRVLSLLAPKEFLGNAPITPARVQPFVVRTSKRVAIDSTGHGLFQPRSTRKVAVIWPDDRPRQRRLYDEVTDYVREGYDLGRREKNNSLVFLMLLMQRLVSSSTRAIEVALERRLLTVSAGESEVRRAQTHSQLAIDDDFWEADPNEQLELLLEARLPAVRQERLTVERLLQLARDAQLEGRDAKLDHLYDLVVRLAQEENDPLAKVLVFTEFLPTQELIVDYLRSMGMEVAILNGQMSIEDREAAQEAFAGTARILVSTEAGGEGLNLQVAHLVVNYDIPWNPMRIEQRIGRVDRIGQQHAVKAFNLVLSGSVEDRVHEVLEAKLATILADFGVDKLSDVLDSSAFEASFQSAYADAVRGLEVDEITSIVAAEVREAGAYLRDWRDVLGGEMPDAAEARAMREHPLPHWVERMTVAGVRAHGGSAQRQTQGWLIEWPDGRSGEYAFDRERAGLRRPMLTLGDDRVAGLLRTTTSGSVDGHVSQVRVGGLSPSIAGIWSLWMIVAHAGPIEFRRALPLLHDADDVLRAPSARAAWDRILEAEVEVDLVGELGADAAERAWTRARSEAEAHGLGTFLQLKTSLEERIRQRRERLLDYIERRRLIIERVGLENVRRRRLGELEREKERELATMPITDVAPELRCVAIFQIVP